MSYRFRVQQPEAARPGRSALPLLIGLSLVSLVIGGLIIGGLLWSKQFESGTAALPNLSHRANIQSASTGTSQRQPISTLAYGRVIELGTYDYQYPDNQIYDSCGVPLFPPPKTHFAGVNPTFVWFDHIVEVACRAWLVEGIRPHVGIYLKLSLTPIPEEL